MGHNNQKDDKDAEKQAEKQDREVRIILTSAMAFMVVISGLIFGLSLDQNGETNSIVTTETTTNQPDKKPVVVAKHGESTDKESPAKEQNPGGRGSDKPKQATMSPWDYMKEYLKSLYNELVH